MILVQTKFEKSHCISCFGHCEDLILSSFSHLSLSTAPLLSLCISTLSIKSQYISTMFLSRLNFKVKTSRQASAVCDWCPCAPVELTFCIWPCAECLIRRTVFVPPDALFWNFSAGERERRDIFALLAVIGARGTLKSYGRCRRLFRHERYLARYSTTGTVMRQGWDIFVP